LGGYSTIWLARALPDDGRLISLEVERRHAEVARANVALAGLSARVEVRLGGGIDGPDRLAAEGNALRSGLGCAEQFLTGERAALRPRHNQGRGFGGMAHSPKTCAALRGSGSTPIGIDRTVFTSIYPA
jgi:hypothetical protein